MNSQQKDTTMTAFQPVLLGSETCAYAMARAFHSAYGLKSIVFGRMQLSVTKFSSIMEPTFFADFTEPESFRRHMVEAGRRLTSERPSTKFLLIACGDDYSELLSRYKNELAPYFTFVSVDADLHDRLSNKTSFYEFCAQYDLPHPRTFVLDRNGAAAGEHHRLPFPFPAAVKPADSVKYLNVDFPGRKKAFILDTPEELDRVVHAIYDAGYDAELIIQDFIPGSDANMRVLNAYVDHNHHVRMMLLGHVLLSDPTPEAIGNYAAIIPDYNEELCVKIKDFLESIGYEGVANFDIKFDPRDGQYKLFEINLRQGRTNFFVTLNGFNLAQCFVDDLVFDKPAERGVIIGHGDSMLLEVPFSTLRKYAEPGAALDRGIALYKSGKYGWTLRYDKDMSLKRRLLLWKLKRMNARNYDLYLGGSN